jgi:hypothetical protein
MEARQIQGREDPRTIDERHEQERERLLGIPEHAFENTKALAVRIGRYKTAQVERNRYSVPTAYRSAEGHEFAGTGVPARPSSADPFYRERGDEVVGFHVDGFHFLGNRMSSVTGKAVD